MYGHFNRLMHQTNALNLLWLANFYPGLLAMCFPCVVMAQNASERNGKHGDCDSGVCCIGCLICAVSAFTLIPCWCCWAAGERSQTRDRYNVEVLFPNPCVST